MCIKSGFNCYLPDLDGSPPLHPRFVGRVPNLNLSSSSPSPSPGRFLKLHRATTREYFRTSSEGRRTLEQSSRFDKSKYISSTIQTGSGGYFEDNQYTMTSQKQSSCPLTVSTSVNICIKKSRSSTRSWSPLTLNSVCIPLGERTVCTTPHGMT